MPTATDKNTDSVATTTNAIVSWRFAIARTPLKTLDRPQK